MIYYLIIDIIIMIDLACVWRVLLQAWKQQMHLEHLINILHITSSQKHQQANIPLLIFKITVNISYGD